MAAKRAAPAKKIAAKKPAAKRLASSTHLTYSANVLGKRRLSDAKVKSMVRAMLEPA
jgi:hypothetical protein